MLLCDFVFCLPHSHLGAKANLQLAENGGQFRCFAFCFPGGHSRMPYQGLIQRPRASGRGWHSGRGPANVVNAWRPKLTSGSSEGRGVKTHRHHRSPAEQQAVTRRSRLRVPII